jgi:hypothetical protein
VTVQEFFNKYVGKHLDVDGVFSAQCVDLFKQFNKEVVNAPNVNGNAVDYWTTFPTNYYKKIANTASNYPQIGDVIIWGKTVGPYGHIAVCKEADPNKFVSFDQNWNVQIDGTGVCEFITHTYWGVLGWLRPNSLPQPQGGGNEVNYQPQIDELTKDLRNVEKLQGTIAKSLEALDIAKNEDITKMGGELLLKLSENSSRIDKNLAELQELIYRRIDTKIEEVYKSLSDGENIVVPPQNGNGLGQFLIKLLDKVKISA